MNKQENKPDEITIDELIIKRKKIIGAGIGLGIVAIIAFAIIFYIAITKKNYALMGLTGGITIPFLPILIYLKQLDKEISLRNANRIS
ncbi:hypothetical protein GJU39_16685 [Pedobacter petrophilus]|uniref:Redox-active disulfide protein 2 n=1 Tax=Pedobacter petrophilus TaxID=1908241 RepID=A0A7K0G1Q3_9SPHI|nr:hypothetical protein [Pedobacter petrophilus]MRX77725.1 hypothetical protein [Pedobacter petrophilus]